MPNLSHMAKGFILANSIFLHTVDKAECAKIRDLYLGNGLSGGLQILQGSQPNIALLLCQILARWPKSLSSLIASFSTPVDKAECAEIQSLYLGNGLSVGLQILQGS